MDKYDEKAGRLLPCRYGLYCERRGMHMDGCEAAKRPAVAAALRKQGVEIERLKAGYQATGLEGWPCPGCEYKDGVFIKHCALHQEMRRLQRELLIIGDMAVTDWNDPVVGAVDAAVPVAPKTYGEYRRAELAKYEAMKAERDDLLTQLKNWLRANGPGGWIDELRREIKRWQRLADAQSHSRDRQT